LESLNFPAKWETIWDLVMGFLAILGLRLGWDIKGKIAFGNGPGFQAQIEELPLKCCILMENPKNNISGRRTKPLRGGPL
jgi:hypothetical protein